MAPVTDSPRTIVFIFPSGCAILRTYLTGKKDGKGIWDMTKTGASKTSEEQRPMMVMSTNLPKELGHRMDNYLRSRYSSVKSKKMLVETAITEFLDREESILVEMETAMEQIIREKRLAQAHRRK